MSGRVRYERPQGHGDSAPLAAARLLQEQCSLSAPLGAAELLGERNSNLPIEVVRNSEQTKASWDVRCTATITLSVAKIIDLSGEVAVKATATARLPRDY